MRGNIPVSVVKALKARGDDLLAFGPQSDGTGIERRLQHIEEPLHLSVMGCAVNGPGEAHDSRIGVTFGRNVGMIYKVRSAASQSGGRRCRRRIRQRSRSACCGRAKRTCARISFN